MKTSLIKNGVAVLLLVMGQNVSAQQFASKAAFEKSEKERANIVSLKIKEVNAYCYKYVNGKPEGKEELVENKKYNSNGFLTEHFTIQDVVSPLVYITTKYVYENNLLVEVALSTILDVMQTKSTSNTLVKYFYKDGQMVNVESKSNDKIDYTINYEYDKNGNQVAYTNTYEGIATKFINEFDSNGNLVLTKRGEAKVVAKSNKLDKAGQIGACFRDGSFTKYDYDSQNNLVLTKSSSQFGTRLIETRYTYNNKNSLVEFEEVHTSFGDADSQRYLDDENKKAYKHYVCSYNDKNMLVEQIYKDSNGNNTYLVKYEYVYY